MEPLHVLITGAAGNIGYALTFRIAGGELCGDRKIVLHLLETERNREKLEGCVYELQDCAFTRVADIIATHDVKEAFTGVDVAFLIGAVPRRDGMNRSDLLSVNGGIFKEQGWALSEYSKPNVKVLVVGNPANTNCQIAYACAPKLGKKNFCAMTRLDHNRAIGELAHKLKVSTDKIKQVAVWGNHSNTQVPDAKHAIVELPEGTFKVTDKLDKEYLEGDFCQTIATRGGAVIKKRGMSSAASAANAALDCMRDWLYGTNGRFVSMAIPVPDNEPYGIKQGVVFSFPCTITDEGEIKVVEGLEIDEWTKKKLEITEAELQTERQTAWELLKL